MQEVNNDFNEKLRLAKEEHKRIHKEYWENLQSFNEPEDIPELPCVGKEEWNNFYVPILLRCVQFQKNGWKLMLSISVIVEIVTEQYGKVTILNMRGINLGIIIPIKSTISRMMMGMIYLSQ